MEVDGNIRMRAYSRMDDIKAGHHSSAFYLLGWRDLAVPYFSF
jgi:hypothetical protein